MIKEIAPITTVKDKMTDVKVLRMSAFSSTFFIVFVLSS